MSATEVPAFIRGLVRSMDDAVPIPGTKWRVGWDAILGLLVPGGGDALAALSHVVLLVYAFRQRLPPIVLARMVLNAGFDAVTGVVPVLGDLFDLAFKANVRNLELVERAQGHANPSRSATRSDYVVVGASITAVLLMMLVPLLLAGMIIAWLWRQVS